jgi:hypothetical protein
MYSTLPEFIAEIKKVSSLIEFIQSAKEFSGTDCQMNHMPEGLFFEKAKFVHELSQKNHPYFVFLNGTLILFLGGRFETFVRNSFEELCINITDKANNYYQLPKEMQSNLIKYTAEVIANPRKYGHGDQGIKTFLKTLSSNLEDTEDLTQINHSCLSITSENMRPDVIADLFKRIGVKDIWGTIGEQAKLRVFFDTSDSNKAKNEAEKFLNVFMDNRNKIAHPPSSFSYPDIEYLKEAVKFFEVFASVFSDAIEVNEIGLKEKVNQKQQLNNSAIKQC